MFKKAIITYKRSVFEKYVLDEKDPNIKKLMKADHITASDLEQNHKDHLKVIDEVVDILKELKIKYRIRKRNEIKMLQDGDLIITIGGDGTLLRTAQHIQEQHVLGINSVPTKSVGALCSLKAEEIKEYLPKVFSGDFKVQKMHRIQTRVNGKVLTDEPINDILYTNTIAAATSRYWIEKGAKKEEHKSSGIWISTASGSTAAICAAGGVEQKLNDHKLQYVVREPYQGIYHPYKLTKGFLKKGESLKITNKMVEARLYLDGPTIFHNLNYGDEIEFTLSENHLKKIIFDKG